MLPPPMDHSMCPAASNFCATDTLAPPPWLAGGQPRAYPSFSTSGVQPDHHGCACATAAAIPCPMPPLPCRVVVHVRHEVHRCGAAQGDHEHERHLDDRVRDAEVRHAVLAVLAGEGKKRRAQGGRSHAGGTTARRVWGRVRYGVKRRLAGGKSSRSCLRALQINYVTSLEEDRYTSRHTRCRCKLQGATPDAVTRLVRILMSYVPSSTRRASYSILCGLHFPPKGPRELVVEDLNFSIMRASFPPQHDVSRHLPPTPSSMAILETYDFATVVVVVAAPWAPARLSA